tara:strand:- start:2879 stop:3085 length:207 start_codon:yes stop_codon:yes gene_type:complete
MALKNYRSLTLPPPPMYQKEEESIFRKMVEQNFEDVSSDIHSIKTQEDKDSSLSLRKYQFLLLGASNG